MHRTISKWLLVPTLEGNTGGTFIRLASGKSASFEDCWCTRYIGTEQGTCVFGKVGVPEGCKWEMVEEPDLRFAGKSYWKSRTNNSVNTGRCSWRRAWEVLAMEKVSWKPTSKTRTPSKCHASNVDKP